MRKLILLITILIFFTGCATFNSRAYDEAFHELNGQAQKRIENKEYPEALVLYRTLSEAEPNNAEVKQNMDMVLDNDPELSFLLRKDKLGSNHTDRLPVKNVEVGKDFMLSAKSHTRLN